MKLRLKSCFGLAICVLLTVSTARADESKAPADRSVVETAPPQSYLRSGQHRGVYRLDVASRRFVSGKAGEPEIWLVGAVHVGEPAYYDALQELLNGQTLVLYEGVGRPAFMSVIPAADDGERAARTRVAVHFAAAMADWYRGRFDSPPRSLAMLHQALKGEGRREAKYLRHAMADAWGRPLKYQRDGAAYTLSSLGADGIIGGRDADADIVHIAAQTVTPQEEQGRGIQQDLAKALGLEFQLDGIDYDREHFLNSDMSMEQIQRRIAEVGVAEAEMERITDLLQGSGFLAGMLKLGLRFVESSPKYQGMFKLMLIELFGKLREGDLAGATGDGKLMRVLLDDRNDVVLGDLKHLLGRADAPQTLAVFYGAAHLHDMEAKLVRMGYKPVEEVWLAAMSVDAKEAGLTESDLALVRAMVDSALLQMRQR